MSQDPKEATKEHFDLETYLEARKIARRISLLCATHIEAGMSEKQGLEIIDELFKMHKIEKSWHPYKFRVGKNTLKAFREKSDSNEILKEEDIFFLDIGPVIQGHEADIGHTYTVGQNKEYAHIQKTVREIFDELQEFWKNNDISGAELYEKAQKITRAKGYELNPKMQGHRLGEFPHAVHYKGKLSDFEKKPIENLWVLELLIRHPEKEFGAFHEDILMK